MKTDLAVEEIAEQLYWIAKDWKPNRGNQFVGYDTKDGRIKLVGYINQAHTEPVEPGVLNLGVLFSPIEFTESNFLSQARIFIRKINEHQAAHGGKREGAGRKPVGEAPKVAFPVSRVASDVADIVRQQVNMTLYVEAAIREKHKRENP